MSLFKRILFLGAFSMLSFNSYAERDKLTSIKSFWEKIEKHDKNEVLVVFDIDNTLIKSREYLGSDTWFNENKSLGNKNCLIGVATPLLTRRNTYDAVEDDTVKYFNLIKNKYTTIALTSRSPELRLETKRQLGLNKIFFKDIQFKSNFDKNDDDMRFFENIFMTSGKNKGEMLFKLLGDDVEKYKKIFFLDDGIHNLENTDDYLDSLKKEKNEKYNNVEAFLYHYDNPVEYDNKQIKNENLPMVINEYGTPSQIKICS